MAAFGSGVKTVLRGTATVEVGFTAGLETVAVDIGTAVVMAKSVVNAWVVTDETSQVVDLNIAPLLTGVQELTLYMSSGTAADNTFKYTWQVIEYH
jgi:hypothetical protein